MTAGGSPTPPVARRVSTTASFHGRRLRDDYGWLRDRDAEEVREYLEAENAYTEAETGAGGSARDALYAEMLGRIREDDSSPPSRHGDYEYYTRMETGRAYPIHCRRPWRSHGGEEVLLDVNALAESHDFFHVGDLEISPDHRLLAYTFDTAGSEAFTLAVKDLVTGELLSERIENVYYSMAWAADCRTLFYTTVDAAHRPYRVWRHELGAPGRDAVVFEEPDERFFVSVGVTRSREYVVISTGSATTSEAHVLRADEPAASPRLFAPRRQDVEYSLDHRADRFYVRTNLAAKNFRVLALPLDAIALEPGEEIVAHREDVTVESLDVFSERMIVRERAAGLARLRVLPFDGSPDHRIELPEAVYCVGSAPNPEFDSPWYRFIYSSLVTPWSTFDYDVARRRLEVRKREEVVGGHEPGDYTTLRLEASAPDGVAVPVSIVHRRGIALDGSNPCLLYAYGSYGIATEPAFSSLLKTLLDRGFVYAIAHVRGGAELGEAWHDAGKMLAKRNTFTDFIAVADRLVEAGYTSPDRLAMRGGSAGGLLVGAVANMRPDLFHVALAHVPFVDVVNTMLDDSIPLTVTEYEEWGDPRDKEHFDYMLSYSPYDNVVAQRYPHMLVTAGLNDPRVQYWEPAKWVAKLRALKTDDNLLLLKTNMGAGHAGPSGRYAYLRERAFEYAFLFDRLGIEV